MRRVLVDGGHIERVQLALVPNAGREQAPFVLRVAAVTQEMVGAAPEAPQVEVVGDRQEAAQIALLALGGPCSQGGSAVELRELFQSAPECSGFEEAAKLAQDAMEAEYFGALQRPRRAAGLHRQGVRPFAGQQPHRLHETGSRRQYLVRRIAHGGAGSAPPRRGTSADFGSRRARSPA
jgi:hypothetical protein